jgi:hypothetical protein
MWGTTSSRGSDVQPANHGNLRQRFSSAFRKCSKSDVLRVDEDVKDITAFCWELSETDVEVDTSSRAKRKFLLCLTRRCRTTPAIARNRSVKGLDIPSKEGHANVLIVSPGSEATRVRLAVFRIKDW